MRLESNQVAKVMTDNAREAPVDAPKPGPLRPCDANHRCGKRLRKPAESQTPASQGARVARATPFGHARCQLSTRDWQVGTIVAVAAACRRLFPPPAACIAPGVIDI